MKKWLIGSLVGAILLFIWQFISWAASGMHDNEYKYHPKQEQIISALSSYLKEDGQYMIPRDNPETSNEDRQEARKAMAGKSYAIIQYKDKFEMEMATPMIRSFITDVLIVLLLIFIVGRRTYVSMGSVWATVMAVGLVAWFWHPYTENIWFQTPTEIIMNALVDWLIAYTIVGLWLGWWLKRFHTTPVAPARPVD